jgi:thioredoxin reductase (NADPH)
MYCSSWCPDCGRARAWLAEKGIAYREVDIYKDEAAAAKVRGWADGKMVTPTFDCGGTIIVRFDRERLERVIAT